MRGLDIDGESLIVMNSPDQFVPMDHPLHPIRAMANQALAATRLLFESMYADGGRESIVPEWLLRALHRQVLYGIRNERHSENLGEFQQTPREVQWIRGS